MKYCFILCFLAGICACQGPPPPRGEAAKAETTAFSLDEVQRRTFDFFWETALPDNYQIPDRWPTDHFSSIAATGFGLTSYIVGAERGFVSREEAAFRTRQTLEVLWNLPQGDQPRGAGGYRGLFYHFLTNDEALRFRTTELSTIDSGLLFAGALSAQAYFDGKTVDEQQIRALTDSLYLRAEWDWMLNDEGRISMGWHPETGFIPHDWNGYNEAMVLLVLAMGSPTHPVPDDAWQRWTDDYKWAEYQGREHLNFSPLFGHQYSHMYIDFRGIRDEYMRTHDSDYFDNSRLATLANRNYCIANSGGFAGYGPDQWGLTACDGPGGLDTLLNGRKVRFFGYRARGASALHEIDDGTIAPTAAGGSYPFTPAESHAALEHLWTTYQDSLVGRYGFKDAFNLTYPNPERPAGWFDRDYLGIDQGPILIQIENHRSGLIWDVMKRSKYIRAGLLRAGFTGGWLDETSADPPNGSAKPN